jgi:hypothetical protein
VCERDKQWRDPLPHAQGVWKHPSTSALLLSTLNCLIMQMNSSTPPVTQPGPNSGHKAFFFSAAALFLQFRALFSFRRSEHKFVPL